MISSECENIWQNTNTLVQNPFVKNSYDDDNKSSTSSF